MIILILVFVCIAIYIIYDETKNRKNKVYKKQFEEITTETNFTKSATEQNEGYVMKNEIYTIIKNLKIIKWLLITLTIIAILFTIKEICTIIFLMNLPELLPEILEEATKNIKLF